MKACQSILGIILMNWKLSALKFLTTENIDSNFKVIFRDKMNQQL